MKYWQLLIIIKYNKINYVKSVLFESPFHETFNFSEMLSI